MNYDYLVIGGGPAGIYCTFRILTNSSEANVLIIERNNYVGGRTRMFDYNGKKVCSGAYGMRPSKDIYGLNLLNQLNMSTEAKKGKVDFSYIKKVEVMETMKILESLVNDGNKFLSTKAFIVENFGYEYYNNFVATAGRTDFEQECITDTITHYGMDDNVIKNLVPIDWNTVWENISKDFNIVHGVDITDIGEVETGFVARSYDQNFYGKKIIIATDLLTVKRLLPFHNIYNGIEGHPFLLLYGVFNQTGNSILKEYIKSSTFVSSPLQNIMPLSQEKDGTGTYIISYSDGPSAQMVSKHLDDYPFLEYLLTSTLGCTDLYGTIISTKSFYNYPGIHYYKYYDGSSTLRDFLNKSLADRKEFIYKAQRPAENIWVVGEMISLHQGWVEGALTSVESVLLDIINK